MAAALQPAARGAVLAAIGACAAAFAAWLWYTPTDSAQKDDLAALKPLAFSTLTGEEAFAMLLTWAPGLLATLAALLLRRWLTKPTAPATAGLGMMLRRALAWQLPPRAFLANWCGGLSAGEALLVAAWLATNAWWLGQGLSRELSSPAASTTSERVGKAGLVFGQMMAPNLMLLFLPVPHTSLVPWLTGLSRNRLVRYHRWLGHGTMWVLSCHAVLYYIYWGVSNKAGGWWDNFSLWADKGGVNNLAGSIAFFVGLLMWATALTWVRRNFYRWFWKTHVLCFIAFFLLSCAHYSGCIWYFAPGLILYAVDVALRAGQMANLTTVVAAKVHDGAGTVTLQMRVDQDMPIRPLQETWVLLPALSRWQWHPVTVASGVGDTMTLHVKAYGTYTKQILRSMRRRHPATVRIAGPVGAEATAGGCALVPNERWRRHDVLVLCGGGVGVTALLSMLRAMAAQRAGGGAQGLPRHVVLVWVARNMGEFKILDSDMVEAAAYGAHGGWLQLRLHHTTSKSTKSLAVAPLDSAPTAPGSFRLVGEGELPCAPEAPSTPHLECLLEDEEGGSRGGEEGEEEGGMEDAEQGSPGRSVHSGSADMSKPSSSIWKGSPDRLAGLQAASEIELARGSAGSGSGSGRRSGSAATDSAFAGGEGAWAASAPGGVGGVGASAAAPGVARAPPADVAACRAGWGDSPFFWRLLRPVQPKSFGTAHLAVVYCLAYFGAFAAALLAASYTAQVEQWKGGMLYATLLSALATGLPFGLAIFPIHAYRYFMVAAAARRGATSQLAAPLSEPLEEGVLLSRGMLRARGSGAAVPILPGRPDFELVLRSVAEGLGSGSSGAIGVYAGGPKGMMTAIHLAVSRLNSAAASTGARFELHREAVEL